jgi:quercetin dioxygenase-like cupin family protein
MKMKRMTWIVVGSMACAVAGAAWAAKKELTMTAVEDLKWTEVPESHGVMISPITGDPFKGAHTMFAKIPAGSKHPNHTHSNDITNVVISGTFLVGLEGSPEKKLGPGSTFFVPGKLKHTSSCAEGAPCVLFQQSPGKFDMKPVAEVPVKKAEAPAKK